MGADKFENTEDILDEYQELHDRLESMELRDSALQNKIRVFLDGTKMLQTQIALSLNDIQKIKADIQGECKSSIIMDMGITHAVKNYDREFGKLLAAVLNQDNAYKRIILTLVSKYEDYDKVMDEHGDVLERQVKGLEQDEEHVDRKMKLLSQLLKPDPSMDEIQEVISPLIAEFLVLHQQHGASSEDACFAVKKKLGVFVKGLRLAKNKNYVRKQFTKFTGDKLPVGDRDD